MSVQLVPIRFRKSNIVNLVITNLIKINTYVHIYNYMDKKSMSWEVCALFLTVISKRTDFPYDF